MNSFPFLLFMAIYALQMCANAKMKKLAREELQIDEWQGINSTTISLPIQMGSPPTLPPPNWSPLMNVRGNVQEVPMPDQNVLLETKLRKVEIVKPKKKEKFGQNERAKREAAALDEPLNDLGDGLETIVDEVVEPNEDEKPAKKAKKTFSKQAVKKEAGTKEKGASGQATATTPTSADKKAAVDAKKGGPSSAASTTTAQKGKSDGKAEEKEKGGGEAGGGTKPASGTAATPNSDPKPAGTAAKDKAPPAAAQMPQGPPMPPPGSIPAPQAPQVQPPSGAPNSSAVSSQSQPPAEAARPSGMAKSANYKLIYFDARGICEPIRLLFNYAKVPFDDVRISRKQWLALKDSTVYGKVPILEVDGKPLTYCHTIARYLARQFGLAGRDNWEQAKVDEISDFHADVAMDLQPYMYVVAGFHQGDKNTLRQAIFLPNVEKHFPVYVNLLKLSGSGFFMPSGITWVDFVIAEYMTTVRHFEPQILDKYPAITKFVRKVQTQPQIFEYVTNREHQPV